jgi:hypothetical protein
MPVSRTLSFFLAAFTFSTLAVAADEKPSRDVLSHDLESYYGGERASAYVVAVLGALSVGGGVALVTQSSDFARGLGWPLVVLGGLEGIGAVIYAFQVGGEIHHYEAALGRDPSAYRREELAHMHGTTSRFVFYRLTELGLALGGIAAASYGFAANADTWKGIGIGVAAMSLPFLVIDTVNNGRASHYQEQLRSFDPPLPDHTAVVPAALLTTPFSMSWGTRF